MGVFASPSNVVDLPFNVIEVVFESAFQSADPKAVDVFTFTLEL